MKEAHCIAEILDFWFGELDATGWPDPTRHQLWFGSSIETDRLIRDRFGNAVAAAVAGELRHWADQADGLVALILLLDQFSRNIYRGTPAAFSGDAQALALVKAAVARGQDRNQANIHRVFLYIPFEHSENLENQDQGIALFDQLLLDCDPGGRARIADFRRYAVAHRDVIARFGRFPHRNASLGRDSSEAELAHLQTHGGF